jgi:SAM-dependent methyltransferase
MLPAFKQSADITHYNQHVDVMQNLAWFYDGILDIWAHCNISSDATICDIGCGTGALLARLQARGYERLSGCDFAPRCVEVSHQKVPTAKVFAHDIQSAPLPQRFDMITMTCVFDFLPDPVAALSNLRNSLTPGGMALITIRNRLAYWPFYHLRGLAHVLPAGRLRHWFQWCTTPLGMRRTDQPYERVYTPGEARTLLHRASLQPVREHGFQWLPMLWIPDMPHVVRFAQKLDHWSHQLPGTTRYYCYAFICKAE